MAKCLGLQNLNVEVPVSILRLAAIWSFSVVPGSTPSMHL